jgi:hypothetical protein
MPMLLPMLVAKLETGELAVAQNAPQHLFRIGHLFTQGSLHLVGAYFFDCLAAHIITPSPPWSPLNRRRFQEQNFEDAILNSMFSQMIQDDLIQKRQFSQVGIVGEPFAGIVLDLRRTEEFGKTFQEAGNVNSALQNSSKSQKELSRKRPLSPFSYISLQ